MASRSDIRFHINSVKQTRQITNAMYLVSTSRMRRAMRGIEQNRAYFYHALDTMKDIRAYTKITHPYLTHRENADKTAFIVIAGEKGLSGSYNHDVLQLADASVRQHEATHIFTVGSVASAHFRRSGYQVDDRFVHIAERPTIEEARRIVAIIMALYDTGEIDELRVVYTSFVNSMVHEPREVKLLPLELDSFGLKREHVRDAREVLYDPSPREVLYALVPQFIIGYVYGTLVNSYASENYARMGAMESATNSADEMLAKLTQQYHSARQLAITNEISEIVGAADSTRQ